MRVYNYAAFVKVFSQAVIKKNMTNVAKILFDPVIELGKCVNRFKKPYIIDSKSASQWHNQKANIPANLKKAANEPDVYYGLGKHFDDKVMDKSLFGNEVEGMLEDLLKLIQTSDLSNRIKLDLEKIYKQGDPGEFLGRAFLVAIQQDNREKEDACEPDSKVNQSPIGEDDSIDAEIAAFNRIIRKINKPIPIMPPEDIAADEMKYITALYRVYEEKTGEICNSPKALVKFPKIKRNFDRQRKNYYLAETIRRGLRDTITLKEKDNFERVKDEMFDGVVDTEEKDYDYGFDRLTAVMERATGVVLSPSVMFVTLNWIGPGEKKGLCHMLVNDGRLDWLDGD